MVSNMVFPTLFVKSWINGRGDKDQERQASKFYIENIEIVEGLQERD